MFGTSRSGSRPELALSSGLAGGFFGSMLDFRIIGGIFLLGQPVGTNRNSADKCLIVCEAFAEDNHTLVRDFILANILGMISTPHLDHHHDLAKLAIDGYVS